MVAKWLCWLGLHDWLCLFRYHWGEDRDSQGFGSETTGWSCSRCGEQRTEQWDT